MGIIRAIVDAGRGTFADQWKDIITVGSFGERDLLKPGYLKAQNRGRGSNVYGSEDVISNGSLFFVPENTVAIIFSQSGIEDFITTPGGYEYQNGQKSIFNRDGLAESIFTEWGHRIDFGGVPSDEKRIGFLNLRELRDIKFGTRGAQIYHDKFYDADLEVTSYGGISQEEADMAAKQKIADGIRDNGFGDGGGMIFGMDMAKMVSSDFRGEKIAGVNLTDPIDSQVEGLRKLKKLVDDGIITNEEFDAKKKSILGI